VKADFLLRLVLGAAVSVGAVHCASGDSSKPSNNDDDNAGDGDDTGDGDDSSNGSMKADAGKKPDASSSTIKDSGNPPPKSDAGAAADSGGPSKTDAGSMSMDAGGPARNYVDLSVAPSTPFDKNKPDAHPTSGYKPPAGWQWYNIDGAKCRDGSQFGVMAHWSASSSKNLFVYFEGGGACANPGFCNLNPSDVSHQFPGKGQIALISTSLENTPQSPGADGIFNFGEAKNPYKDWNFVYIPYCTGDVHFGGNPKGTIKDVSGTLNFSGAANSKAVIARTLATWPDTTRFIAGGSSAGGYGAGLNYGMIQDSFKNAEGSAILDASPPFNNTYAPICLQKRWREAWALDANIPSDCGETCKSADGGNLFNIVEYWRAKYPKAHIALISGIHDEIIRLFFALGNNNCADYETMDPVLGFIGSLGQTYDPDKFAMGLTQIRTDYVSTGQLATYYEDGFPNSTVHQCLFDSRLYTEAAGSGKGTIADFLVKFNNDQMTQVGP
jgi:hypothetical protein